MKLHNQAMNRLFDKYLPQAEKEPMRAQWAPYLEKVEISVVSRCVDHFTKEWNRIPSLAEFLDHATTEERLQAKRKKQTEVRNCPNCDSGFVTVQHEPFTVRPCHNCLPETYDAWVTGQYEPDS
jgi:hypothetical protein